MRTAVSSFCGLDSLLFYSCCCVVVFLLLRLSMLDGIHVVEQFGSYYTICVHQFCYFYLPFSALSLLASQHTINS